MTVGFAKNGWRKKILSEVNSTPDLESNVGQIDADANIEPQQDSASDIKALLSAAMNLVATMPWSETILPVHSMPSLMNDI